MESYKTVLEAALDEGIDMPHDCKLGTCLVSQPTSLTHGPSIQWHILTTMAIVANQRHTINLIINIQACAAKVVSGTVDQTGGTLDDSVMEQVHSVCVP